MPKGIYPRKPFTSEHIKNMSKARMGNKNNMWLGSKVKYGSLHSWVRRKLGTPHWCEICKNKNLRRRQYHWSNISRKYKRKLTDWRRLCVKCHKKYDKKQTSTTH
jgi:hypothetical protein